MCYCNVLFGFCNIGFEWYIGYSYYIVNSDPDNADVHHQLQELWGRVLNVWSSPGYNGESYVGG